MTHYSGVHIVLGGTGGIGSALCRRLSSDGARVIAAARNSGQLEHLRQSLQVDVHTIDGTVYEDVQRVVDTVVDRYGRLDGIANCIGSLLLKPAHLCSPREFEDVIRTNLLTAFNTVKASARVMLTHGGGSIVLCSSAAVRSGIVNHEAIAAAKAGVEGLMKASAATYAYRNIRVNCVAPGLTETPLTATMLNNAMARQQSEAMHALGRLGSPEDIASAMHWLLDSTQSGWVTGQVLAVDGGLSSVRARGSQAARPSNMIAG